MFISQKNMFKFKQKKRIYNMIQPYSEEEKEYIKKLIQKHGKNKKTKKEEQNNS